MRCRHVGHGAAQRMLVAALLRGAAAARGLGASSVEPACEALRVAGGGLGDGLGGQENNNGAVGGHDGLRHQVVVLNEFCKGKEERGG